MRKWRFKELRKFSCITGRVKIEIGFSLIPQPKEERKAGKEKGRGKMKGGRGLEEERKKWKK